MQFALAGTLLWSMRGALRSWWLAVPAAFLLTVILSSEAVLVVGFTAAVALIAGRPRTPIERQLLAVGLGVLAGVECLSKVNLGVLLVAELILAAVVVRDRRVRITLAAAFCASAGLAWIVTGQSLTAIPGYISGSLAITSGYASAMVIPDGPHWQIYTALLFGVLGVMVAHRAGEGLAKRIRVGLLLAWIGLWFVVFKGGFVRHDPGHAITFATEYLGALTAFGWAAQRRETALLAAFAPVLLWFALTGADPQGLVHPRTKARAYFTQAGIVTDGSKTNEQIEAARGGVTAAVPLDASIQAALKGHQFSIDPWEVSIPFGYGMDWKPLAVYQNYVAYTASLDQRNAHRLESDKGPDRILRHSLIALNNRNPVWDSPAANRAMLCNYRQLGAAAGEWQVLERAPGRCGKPREFATVKAKLGQAVPVPTAPSADQLVYVDIEGYAPGLFEKLRKTLYRTITRAVLLDTNRLYFMPPDVAQDGLLLRVPKRADFSPAPFGMDLAPQTITLFRGSEPVQPDDTATLHFMAASIR